jgi:hypothetical protein
VRPAVAVLALPAVLALLPAATAAVEVPAAVPIVVAQVPVSAPAAPPLAAGTLRVAGGEGGRLVLVPPRGKPRVLTASFHSAAPSAAFSE